MRDEEEIAPYPACVKRSYDLLLRSTDFRYGGAHEFAVRRCRVCDLVATHPRLSWEELTAYYPDEYSVLRKVS